MSSVPPSILPGLSVVGSAEGQKVQLFGVFFSQNVCLLVRLINDIDDRAEKQIQCFSQNVQFLSANA